MWRPRCPRRGGEPTEAATLLQPLSGFQLLLQASHTALPGGWDVSGAPTLESCGGPCTTGPGQLLGAHGHWAVGQGGRCVTVQLGHLHEGG